MSWFSAIVEKSRVFGLRRVCVCEERDRDRGFVVGKRRVGSAGPCVHMTQFSLIMINTLNKNFP